MDELVEAIQQLTAEIRQLRTELRPELRQSAVVREVQKKSTTVSLAAADFLSRQNINTMCKGKPYDTVQRVEPTVKSNGRP